MWVNNQTWCSGHVKAFTVVTNRPYHPGACTICVIKAYFGLLSNGENAKIKTKQQLLIYKFVTGGGIREILFFSFGNSFNETTSILEGRVAKVSHSTRTAILQLVDPACAAAQEHVETRIWNFHFLSVFSAKLRLGHISAVVTGWRIREILFFRLAILMMK